MDIFNNDLVEFFQVINKYSVKYILVGGLAVNHYGYSRATGDIDLWMEDSDENRKKFVAALKERNVEGCEAFLTYPFIAGYSEIILDNGLFVDLMSDLQLFKQDNFEECYQLSDKFKMEEGVEVNVLHINKLIEEKEKSARPKDKEDAEQLKKLYRK